MKLLQKIAENRDVRKYGPVVDTFEALEGGKFQVAGPVDRKESSRTNGLPTLLSIKRKPALREV